MDKIKERIVVLQKENDQINRRLNEIAVEREQLIQKAIENNGRILELEQLNSEELNKEE